MATDIPMIEALEHYAEHLFQLFSQLRQGVMPSNSEIDEYEAWTRLLKEHVRAQKKLGGQYPNDSYSYDPGSKTIKRYRHGKVVGTI